MPNEPKHLDPNSGFVQSVAKFAREHGYTGEIKPDEVRAIERVQIIERLGFQVGAEMIERELKLTRTTNVRTAELVTADLSASHKTISLMEG